MPDIDFNDTLKALRTDTERVGLANAADVRRHGDRRTQRTVAATGLTAALCLVAAAIGFGGLDDGKERAVETPATQPKLASTSLLISDELPPSLPGVALSGWKASGRASEGEGEGEALAAPCQQGSLKDLGAERAWHANFLGENLFADDEASQEVNKGALGDVQAGQVTAQFASAERAQAAMKAIDGWFDNCSLTEPRRWPDVRVGGARARLIEYSATPSATDPWRLVGYGISGNAITLVSFALIPTDVGGGAGEGLLGDAEQTHRTLRFALLRIAGVRTTTSNAVARKFRFAEERSGEWQSSQEPGGGSVGRDFYLGHPWHANPCPDPEKNDGYGALKSLPSDALRTGMLLVDNYGGDPTVTPVRQLALYPDASTAKNVAEELAAEYARCATTPDEFGVPTTWTTETGTWTAELGGGPHELTFAWSASQEDPSGKPTSPFTRGVAIVHRANGVLLVFDADNAQPGPNSPVMQRVRKGVADNVDLICEVADCE